MRGYAAVVVACTVFAAGCASAPAAGRTGAASSIPGAAASTAAAASVARSSAPPAPTVGPATTAPDAWDPAKASASAIATTSPTQVPLGRLDVVRTYAWTGRTGQVGVRPEYGYTLPTSVKQAPACKADDLSLHPWEGAGLGTAYLAVLVRNEGPTCRLTNYAHITMTDAHGVVWNSTGSERDQNTSVATIVLVRGSWAELSGGGLALGSTCGGYGHTTTIRLTLPGDGGSTRIDHSLGSTGPNRCLDSGPDAGRAPKPHPGSFQQEPFQVIAHARFDDYLTAPDRLVRVFAPRTARRGTTLDYKVYVSPQHDQAALWDSPCPLFRQTLDGTGPTYELNCNPLEFLYSADQAGVFDMQVPVPPDAPLGPTTLSWQLVEPQQPPVTTTVDVTQ